VETAIENGCIFVMDRLLLPAALRFQGRRYADGWPLLNSLKSNDIELRARDCGWNFIFRPRGGDARRWVLDGHGVSERR
jgi:hypothetical protein